MTDEPWKDAHDALAAYHKETQRAGRTRETVLARWDRYVAARDHAREHVPDTAGAALARKRWDGS